MKVLIKHKRSGLYVASKGGWTAQAERVKDFRTSEAADHFCHCHAHHHAFATVIRFQNKRHDIEFPRPH